MKASWAMAMMERSNGMHMNEIWPMVLAPLRLPMVGSMPSATLSFEMVLIDRLLIGRKHPIKP